MKFWPRREALAIALVASLLLSGCAPSDLLYVADKETGTYFTVPSAWLEIPEKALDKAEFDQIDSAAAQERYDLVQWQAAYAPKRLSAVAVLGSKAADVPVVFVRVRKLAAGERNSISLNTLRNLVFPVTTLGPNSQTPLNLDGDQEIQQGDYVGVDLEFDLTLDQQSQKLRQIALMAPDRSNVYLFVVRCSTTCFQKNEAVIGKIADSFTVRGNRG